MAYLRKKFKGFNISIGSMMLGNSSQASLSLFFAFIACKFSFDDDVINVCEIENVREANNSPLA
jgi:hypothetical protein